MEYDNEGRYVLFPLCELDKFNSKQSVVYTTTISTLSLFFRKGEICKVGNIEVVISQLQLNKKKTKDSVSLHIIDTALIVAQLQKDKYHCAKFVWESLSVLGTPTCSIRYYIQLNAVKNTFLDYRNYYRDEECLKILREGYAELLRCEAIYEGFGIDLHSEFVSEDIVNLPINDDKQSFYADTSICKGVISDTSGAYLDNCGYIRFDDTNICY